MELFGRSVAGFRKRSQKFAHVDVLLPPFAGVGVLIILRFQQVDLAIAMLDVESVGDSRDISSAVCRVVVIV